MSPRGPAGRGVRALRRKSRRRRSHLHTDRNTVCICVLDLTANDRGPAAARNMSVSRQFIACTNPARAALLFRRRADAVRAVRYCRAPEPTEMMQSGRQRRLITSHWRPRQCALGPQLAVPACARTCPIPASFAGAAVRHFYWRDILQRALALSLPLSEGGCYRSHGFR